MARRLITTAGRAASWLLWAFAIGWLAALTHRTSILMPGPSNNAVESTGCPCHGAPVNQARGITTCRTTGEQLEPPLPRLEGGRHVCPCHRRPLELLEDGTVVCAVERTVLPAAALEQAG